MVIGSARIVLALHGVRSLKEKRKIVHGVRDRVKSRFNVAVAEVDDLDLHQRATLGVAVVSNEAAHADSQLQTVIRFIEESVTVAAVDVELLSRWS
jgi:uncharacterized protein YlxP (DUF503 family)